MATVGENPDYDRMKEVREFDDSNAGVKGLIDSGITTIPSFFIHPPENLTSLKSSKSSFDIPVINLSGINSNHRRQEIVDQIREAASTWGFFQVTNHGIPDAILKDTITVIQAFHEQPMEMKKQYYGRDKGLEIQVTYYTNIDLLYSKAASWGDTLQVNFLPNPPELDKLPVICGKEMLVWEKHATGLAEKLMELMCEGLGLSSGRLKELSGLTGRIMVAHYYPYCPQPDLTMGIPSHTDLGVLTVLLQDQTGGLQVKHGEEWVDVKPLPGALVINAGDYLQIISNDEFKSGEHRVLANSYQNPRISIALFVSAGEDGNVEYHGPLEELVSPEKPARYRKFTISEFGKKFFTKELANLSLIDCFKLSE